jgi:hypothetical protein
MVKPGKAPDGGLLIPLEKGRAGEEAPAFSVELIYLDRGTRWEGKAKVGITLLGVDLPISKTGLQVYYSPLFKLTPELGSFRAQQYEAPASIALRATSVEGDTASYKRDEDEPNQGFYGGKAQQQAAVPNVTQQLVERFQKQGRGARATGILPVRIPFPKFGPSIFLVSELTSENQTPVVEFTFEQLRKRGAK